MDIDNESNKKCIITMEMTELMKESLLASPTFGNAVIASMNEVAANVMVEDPTTPNHINRYGFALLYLFSGYQVSMPKRMLDNQAIDFNSSQDDYNTAVLAEWDNTANDIITRINK